MRKIRRDIIKTINTLREAHRSPSIYNDIMANRAATEYAQFLLNNPEDEQKLKDIQKAYMLSGHFVPLVGYAFLDEDEDNQGPLNDQLMDAHGLLIELEYESGILVDPKNTHIGVGFATNNEKVLVVELVTEKPIMVQSLSQTEDGGVEARGLVLNREVGLYAARVVSQAKLNKDIAVVGPPRIHFDKSSGNFILNIPGPIEKGFYCVEDPKVV
jgi:hypothetical protein